eukprot:6040786-Amphidinium_carterae.1
MGLGSLRGGGRSSISEKLRGGAAVTMEQVPTQASLSTLAVQGQRYASKKVPTWPNPTPDRERLACILYPATLRQKESPSDVTQSTSACLA